jgi:hypothetical protein
MLLSQQFEFHVPLRPTLKGFVPGYGMVLQYGQLSKCSVLHPQRQESGDRVFSRVRDPRYDVRGQFRGQGVAPDALEHLNQLERSPAGSNGIPSTGVDDLFCGLGDCLGWLIAQKPQQVVDSSVVWVLRIGAKRLDERINHLRRLHFAGYDCEESPEIARRAEMLGELQEPPLDRMRDLAFEASAKGSLVINCGFAVRYVKGSWRGC